MKQSQYPELQAILPRLLLASPRRLGAPIFATKEEAEHFLGFLKREDPSSEAVLTPVWRVDHNDLEESQISGWSVRTDIA